MASRGELQVPWTCDLCASVLFFQLQPEDAPGTAHHRSRKALEESAETCNLCRMILRAAISNYHDSRGIRYGKGYWRQFDNIKYHDESGVRDVLYIKEMGACMPPEDVDFSKRSFPAHLAPTGMIDTENHHIEHEDALPQLGSLEAESLTDALPVWLYGNWWAEFEPRHDGDQSHLRLVGVGARFGRSESHFDAFNVKPGEFSIRGSALGICTDDHSLFKQIPGRLREMRSDSEIAFGRLENWLKECSLDHPWCVAPHRYHELPNRVIDVYGSDDGVAVIESNGQRDRYVTLSHCWGTSSRLMATKKTIDDLRNGITISSLPRTFQDAIKITRRLGVRYLWIDCLSIIQDDPLDWERESSRMAQIYRHSYLTISASGSSSSYSGCFPGRIKDSYVSPATRSLGYHVPREATGPNSHVVEYEHSSQPGRLNRIHLFEEWLPGSTSYALQRARIGSFGKLFDPMAEEPLSSRGWTLQERLLSPRIIHYGTDQMYFECESHLVSEDGFKFSDVPFSLERLLFTQRIPFEDHGLSKTGISYIVGKHAGGPPSGPRWQGGWLSLVENFSKRKLTVIQDKLSALAGVARAIAEETGDFYFAGIWAHHFMEDLFWRVYAQEEHFEKNDEGLAKRPAKGRVIGDVTRPTEYRAPSWSWASLDGPIKFIPLSYRNLVARVRDCYTKPAGADQYGRVSEGKLDIEGPIFEIQPHEPRGKWEWHGIPVKIELGDERGTCIGAVHPDSPDEPLEYPCYALFLDPAYALVIKCKDFEPFRDDQGNEDEEILVPKPIMTTEDINRSFREPPEGDTIIYLKGDETNEDPEKRVPYPVTITAETHKELNEYFKQNNTMAHKALNDAVRIGVGVFVERSSVEAEQGEKVRYDPQVHGELKPENILHVEGDESWGSVTNEDAKIWVTIV